MEQKKERIYVAGHNGLAGGAIVRELLSGTNIGTGIEIEIITRNRCELDLTRQSEVEQFFKESKIDVVYLAAAKVGGIYANSIYPADYMYENLIIQANVIRAAFLYGVKRFLFLGSSCIYPKYAQQPLVEEALLTSSLEPTNEPYALAKIAGLKLIESINKQYGERLCLDYRSVMPTNLYGPGDNYHPENSHVIAGLIRRFHEAKISNLPFVTVWGTGTVRREFLHCDDFASACVHILNIQKDEFQLLTKDIGSFLNIGTGSDIMISHVAEIIKEVVGYAGEILFDSTKPDGTPQKLLDSRRLYSTGWSPKIDFKTGIINAYEHFQKTLIDAVDQ